MITIPLEFFDEPELGLQCGLHKLGVSQELGVPLEGFTGDLYVYLSIGYIRLLYGDI